MREGDDLYITRQFVAVHVNLLVLEDVLDYLGIDLPRRTGHETVEPRQHAELLGVAVRGEPLGLAPILEKLLEEAVHHVDGPNFGCSGEGDKVGGLRLYLAGFEEVGLYDEVFFEVGGVVEEKALEVGNVSVGVEDCVESFGEGQGDGEDDRIWNGEGLLLLAVSQHPQINKLIILVQVGNGGLGEIGVHLQAELVVSLR
jgi:hypothetical protein